jgi:agmatinase
MFNYEKRYFTFSGMKNPELESSDVIILPIPYDSTASYTPGSRNGPRAIILASADMELYDHHYNEEVTDVVKVYTAPEMMPNVDSPRKMIDQIKNATTEILEANKFPVIIGGEHSITLGVVEALYEKDKDFTVVQIDAHADSRDTYEESKYSHGCVVRRIRDLGLDVIQIGIRSHSWEEADYIEKNNLKDSIFFAREAENNIEKVLSKINTNNIYITVDVDGFDPSVMPGTGTLEPNGLRWEPTLKLLKKLAQEKNIIGFDVVEVNPTGVTTQTEDNAARLILKIISYIFEKRR